eukprot:jgi/Bigna1/134142/aug1.24_g8850
MMMTEGSRPRRGRRRRASHQTVAPLLVLLLVESCVSGTYAKQQAAPLPTSLSRGAYGRPAKICHPRSECPEYELLYKYVEENKIEKYDLAIAEFHGPMEGIRYRGLVTVTPKRKGDLLIRVPLEAMISRTSAVSSSIGPLLQALEKITGPRIVLSLYLLYEYFEKQRREQKSSRLEGYFVSLPGDINSLLSFSDDDMAELQCPSDDACPGLAGVSLARKEALAHLQKTHEVLTPSLTKMGVFQAETLSKENLTWAYSMVRSRSFSLSPDNDTILQQGFLMAPFADLINHHNIGPLTEQQYAYNVTTKTLEIRADQDYAGGEEVFISYGALSNPHLLLNYGFSLPDNILESIGLKVSLDESDPEMRVKRGIVSKILEHNPNATEARLTLSGDLPLDFIDVLRLKHERNVEAKIQALRRNSSKSTGETEGGGEKKKKEKEEGVEIVDLAKDIMEKEEEEKKKKEGGEEEGRNDTSKASKEIQSDGEGKAEDIPNKQQSNWKENGLNARKMNAVMFRVEMKRIIHVAILEALRRIQISFQDAAGVMKKHQKIPQQIQTKEEASERRAREMKDAAWVAWEADISKWSDEYERWRAKIDGVWVEKRNMKTYFAKAVDLKEAVSMAWQSHSKDTVRGVVEKLIGDAVLKQNLAINTTELYRPDDRNVSNSSEVAASFSHANNEDGGRSSSLPAAAASMKASLQAKHD